jgi:hypothetical protein
MYRAEEKASYKARKDNSEEASRRQLGKGRTSETRWNSVRSI